MPAIERQRIHLLRTRREARHGVHRQHRHLARGERLHQLGVLRRPDEDDQRRAFLQLGDLRRVEGARTLKTMSAATTLRRRSRSSPRPRRSRRRGNWRRCRRPTPRPPPRSRGRSSFLTASGAVATRFSSAYVSFGIPMVDGILVLPRSIARDDRFQHARHPYANFTYQASAQAGFRRSQAISEQ